MCFLECRTEDVVVLTMKTFERLLADRAGVLGTIEIDLGGVTASVTRHPYSIEVHWIEFPVQRCGLVYDGAIDLPRFRVSGTQELAQLWKEIGASILRETARALRERVESDVAVMEFEERCDARRLAP